MSLTNRPLVFVSYSRKDSEAVGRLVEKLKTAGFPIWFDTHTITAGEWKRQIDEGLRRSQFFLACVSKNTNIRGEVLQYEWSNALEIQRKRLEGERYLIPVLIEDVSRPPEFADLQSVNLWKESDFEQLKQWLNTKTSRKRLWALLVAAAASLAIVYFAYNQGRRDTLREARSVSVDEAAGSTTPRLGVTLWKLEHSNPSDPRSVREIVHPPAAGQSPVEYTPVRVDNTNSLRLGDRIQFGIESSRPGYLYVVNRALRTGSEGPMCLVFPTLRQYAGENYIVPGKLVQLPGPQADPPYFKLQSERPDYVGEKLIILLSPERQPDIVAHSQCAPISEQTVNKWLALWGKDVKILSGPVDAQQARLTPAEAEARRGDRRLGPVDPGPQWEFEARRPAVTPMAAEFAFKVGEDP